MLLTSKLTYAICPAKRRPSAAPQYTIMGVPSVGAAFRALREARDEGSAEYLLLVQELLAGLLPFLLDCGGLEVGATLEERGMQHLGRAPFRGGLQLLTAVTSTRGSCKDALGGNNTITASRTVDLTLV